MRREKGPEKIFEDIIAENSPTLGKKTAFCRLKKDVQLESCELFYLGQNEDYSPGGSISDSSEKLFQSGSWGKSIYKVLVKVESNTMKHSFYKRFFVSHEELMSP